MASGTVQDEADLSKLDLQTELDLGLLEIRAETIRRIDHAIERIDAGIYGICDECGGRITAERLRAFRLPRSAWIVRPASRGTSTADVRSANGL
jgi:RNA polymerase-binding transcription factor DksA